jgi:hypothetical protein
MTMGAAPRVVLVTGPLADSPREITLDRPMTIAEVVETQRLAFRLPTIAVMAEDGKPAPVLRGSWHVRMVGEGETLCFVAMPGGRRGNGKNILGLVASLALAIAAPFVGGAVAGALGGSAIVKGIASVAFVAGGTPLLDAVIPPPRGAYS